MSAALDTVDALLVSLLRDYEQSGRALYHQMLANLPRWRRWFYSQNSHHDRLARLASEGIVQTRTWGPSRIGGPVQWYRRAPNLTSTN